MTMILHPQIPARLTTLFFFFSLLLFSAAAFSQTITGAVTDADKRPISRATVQVKGTSRAALTDNAGKFTINASRNDALIVTSVGFVAQEVPINGRQSVEITMAADIRNMEDVVVTALGIKRESRRLGYSATTAKVEEM